MTRTFRYCPRCGAETEVVPGKTGIPRTRCKRECWDE